MAPLVARTAPRQRVREPIRGTTRLGRSKINGVSVRIVAVLCLFAAIRPADAQPSQSGSRYMNAYKEFVDASCPLPGDTVQHFVYFARDREAMPDHPFLRNDRFRGAQIMYPWKHLEVEEGRYDFSTIEEDYEYLRARGKRLFIQLQDATFNPGIHAIPDYLHSDMYDGGESPQVNDDGDPTGWLAKRWNANVRERFDRLLNALGERFDGKIEGINLQETSISDPSAWDSTYSNDAYVEAVKSNMRALREAFPHATTLQYANFMPGEWLPWEDKGFLRSIYQYGEEIGVGLGAPDLMVQRRGQLNHPLAMMHEGTFTVPVGIAVQDGNYVGLTGDEPSTRAASPDTTEQRRARRPNIVPLLHAFAVNFLHVDYMFWVAQPPYFEEDVLPCFTSAQ